MKSIIKELFVNKEQYVLNLLVKHSLNQPIQNLVKIINARIQRQHLKSIGLKGIPSSFLTIINYKYISKVQGKNEKEELEYLIAEITIYFLNKYIQSVKAPQSEIIHELKIELKSACELNNFDYKELNRAFPIETLVKFAKNSINKSEESNLLTKPPIYYYEWNGRYNYDLDDLVKNLETENHILDVRGFKKIFNKHSGDITILINRESLDFIIVLFDILGNKNKQLLIPQGRNCGKFHPLKIYAVDFEKKVLINNPPIMNLINKGL